jgi:hypothetical protein
MQKKTNINDDTTEFKMIENQAKMKGPRKGPDLDTDNDGYWSVSELEDFATFSSEHFGTTLDVNSILSNYDTDGDNMISETEREALAQDNGLNLPPPRPRESKISGMLNTYLENSTSDEELTSLMDLFV